MNDTHTAGSAGQNTALSRLFGDSLPILARNGADPIPTGKNLFSGRKDLSTTQATLIEFEFTEPDALASFAELFKLIGRPIPSILTIIGTGPNGYITTRADGGPVWQDAPADHKPAGKAAAADTNADTGNNAAATDATDATDSNTSDGNGGGGRLIRTPVTDVKEIEPFMAAAMQSLAEAAMAAAKRHRAREENNPTIADAERARDRLARSVAAEEAKAKKAGAKGPKKQKSGPETDLLF